MDAGVAARTLKMPPYHIALAYSLGALGLYLAGEGANAVSSLTCHCYSRIFFGMMVESAISRLTYHVLYYPLYLYIPVKDRTPGCDRAKVHNLARCTHMRVPYVYGIGVW